ncbi:MAG: hypothetical protein AAF907_12920 [Planctomycetota bacterium]
MVIPLCWFVAGLASTLAVGLWLQVAAEEKEEWEARWPPISDEEFLARCSPGVDPQIALTVRTIFSDISLIPREQIYPEQSLIRDLYLE